MSQVETERLLAYLVDQELKHRKKNKTFKGSFAAICHFFGYQGRSAVPSLFDQQLGTTYGYTAAVLIQNHLSGYSVTARGLTKPHQEWLLGGIPLIDFVNIKEKSSYGIQKPVVPSYDVDLNSRSFQQLQKLRKSWETSDFYQNSGPVQFLGPQKDLRTQTLILEH